MKNVKKTEGSVLQAVAEVEKDIFRLNFRTLKRLKENNVADFERIVELGGARDLDTEQKVELLKLAMRYGQVASQVEQYIDELIAGLRWNEGPQMNNIYSAMHRTKNNPMCYLSATLGCIEHWSPDGIVAQSIVSMLQKHMPLIVVGGEIGTDDEDAAVARLMGAVSKKG